MPFITQGKTNLKYILIVVILAAIIGGGILGYYYLWIADLERKIAEIEIRLPVKVEEMMINPIEDINNPEFTKYFSLIIKANPELKFTKGEPRPISPRQVGYPFPPSNKEDPMWIFSPDGTKAVSTFAQFGEPDSSLDIYNRNNNGKVENLGFCGTVCGYEAALWLDNTRFITFEPVSNDYYKLYIILYNLKENNRVTYSSQELREWPELSRWPKEWQEREMRVCIAVFKDEVFCEDNYGPQ